MNIIIFSINKWALKYLQDSFNENQLKKVTLITDSVTEEIKKFLFSKDIDFIETKTLSLKTLDNLNLKDSLVISAGSPWIFRFSLQIIIWTNSWTKEEDHT